MDKYVTYIEIVMKTMAQIIAGIRVNFFKLAASPACLGFFNAITNNCTLEIKDSASTIKQSNHEKSKVSVTLSMYRINTFNRINKISHIIP